LKPFKFLLIIKLELYFIH